jgi:hypothetical protein
LSLSEFVLEGNGGFIAERGVEAVGVVDVVDEGADVASGVFEVGVGPAVDFLGLQGLHEALGFGVVVWIARPAHAALEPAPVQTSRVSVAGVLHARDRNGG